jgi:hypothetical protein
MNGSIDLSPVSTKLCSMEFLTHTLLAKAGLKPPVTDVKEQS